MTAYKYELKIWGMELLQVNRLAETDTTKSVPSRYHVASIPVAAHLLQEDEVSSPQEETSRCAEVLDHEVSESAESDFKSDKAAQSDPRMFQVGDHVEVISEALQVKQLL